MIVRQGRRITLTPTPRDANQRPTAFNSTIVWTFSSSTGLLTRIGPDGRWIDITLLPSVSAGTITVTATDGNSIVGTFSIVVPAANPVPDVPASYTIVSGAPLTNKYRSNSVAN